MGVQLPSSAICFVLLLLLFASKGEAVLGAGEHDGQHGTGGGVTSGKSQGFAYSKLPSFDLNGQEVPVEELKRSLNQRSEHFHEQLQRIEKKVEGKKMTKLDKEDFDFVKMARSHQLLERAVELQKAFDVDGSAHAKDEAFHTAREHYTKATLAFIELEQRPSGLTEEMTDLMKFLRAVQKENIAENKDKEAMQKMLGYAQRVARPLAQIVAQRPNPFVQLQKAGELLEQASQLREAIRNCEKEKKQQQQHELEAFEHHALLEYLHFARTLEHLADENGPRRSMYGSIELSDIDRKIEEETGVEQEKATENDKKTVFKAIRQLLPESHGKIADLRVFNADFWRFIRRLLHDYSQLALPQMGEVKIHRFSTMITLRVGQLEYVKEGAAARRKVRDYLEDYVPNSAAEKASTFAPTTRLVRLADADRVFFAMAQHGWSCTRREFRDERKEGSHVFVYNFLCQLFGGACPGKENLPANFVARDAQFPAHSVFTHPELLFKNENYQPPPNPFSCVLHQRQYEVTFELDGTRLVNREQWPQMPPVVEYEFGNKYPENDKPPADRLYMQEQTEEYFPSAAAAAAANVAAAAADSEGSSSSSSKTAAGIGGHQGKRYFKAKLSAYLCKEEDGRQHATIEHLKVLDQLYKVMHVQLQMQERTAQPNVHLHDVDLNKEKNFRIESVRHGAQRAYWDSKWF